MRWKKNDLKAGHLVRENRSNDTTGCGPALPAPAGCGLKHSGHPFLQDSQMLAQAVAFGQFLQPSQWFVHVFKREFESAIMHRHQPFCGHVAERFYGFVGPHVDMSKSVWIIGTD